MKKFYRRLSLFLAFALLFALCSCGLYDSERGTVNYRLMDYTRPDMDELTELINGIVAEINSDGEYSEKLASLNSLNSPYWNFYTMSTLASIRRSVDYSDEHYAAECEFFDTAMPAFSQLVTSVYNACADSPYKTNFEADYFDAGGLDGYGGDYSYPDELVELFSRASAYETEYYTLVSSVGDIYADVSENAADEEYAEAYNAYLSSINEAACDIYLRLIQVRGQIAEYYGYDSYVDYSLDGTLYDAATVAEYRKLLQEQLVPLFGRLRDAGCDKAFDNITASGTPLLTVAGKLTKKISPELYNIFKYMKNYSLCDVGYSENKLTSAYTTYIDWYDAPFIVMNSTGYDDDILTFMHEFGHFSDSYINYDRTYETEACEFSSQGLEYMCLLYLDDVGLPAESVQAVREYAMFDAVESMLTQCWINEFETAAYSADAGTLTREGLNELSLECAKLYGLDDYGNDTSLSWAGIEHIFAYPMYTISYCISADAALQLYALESAEAGAGVKVYLDGVEGNDENSYFDNLTRIGLALPFEKTSVEAYVKTVEDCLSGAVG